VNNNLKYHVTFVLSVGGHTFEALALIDRLASFLVPSYLICDDNLFATKKIRVHGDVTKIRSSFKAVKTKSFLNIIAEIFKFIVAFFQSIKGLKSFNSDALVSFGSGASFASMVAAKFLRIKIIYIESVCRIKTRSLCGIIAYRLLADLFLVQWEDLINVYPRAKYAGRPF
jgi:UDP-N-acetylglucosamine:LPS N-acetylglucosamine transferase